MAAPKKEATVKVEDTAAKTVKNATPAKAEEVKAVPAKTEEVKSVEKKPVKAEEVKKPVKKQTVEKKASVKKATAKKTSEKDTKLKSEFHIQFSGKSYSQDDLVKMAKDVWKYDLKRKVSEFKNAEFYIKPEENMVYYVINKEVTGSFYI